MSLPQDFRTELRTLLVASFDVAGLQMLVNDHVPNGPVLLAAVAWADPKDTVAFNMVAVIEAQGLVGPLIAGIVAARPHLPEAQALAARWTQLPQSRTAGPPPVRDQVIVFGERFARFRDEFRVLNGYKELHDVLHKLQGMREGIRQAVAQARGQPPAPRPLANLVEALQAEYLPLARTGVEAIRDQGDDAVADWLAQFEAAVTDLDKASNPQAVDLAAEALRALPANQRGVNDELVRCARRLRVDALAAVLDNILPGLAAAGATGRTLLAALRAGLVEIGASRQHLLTLIAEHNTCQGIEEVFSLTEDVKNLTPAQVPGWDDAQNDLRGYAAGRPGDLRAQRLVATLDRLVAAAAAGDAVRTADEFADLVNRFRMLFNRTDEELLAVTDDLVRVADRLDAQMRTWIDVQPN